MSRMEKVWVDPMGKWVETGHVIGTSDVELCVTWWAVIVDVLNEHREGLIGAHWRRYNAAAGKLRAANDVLRQLKSKVGAEQWERRNQLFSTLLDGDNYQLLMAASDLRRAKMAYLERLQILHLNRTTRELA